MLPSVFLPIAYVLGWFIASMVRIQSVAIGWEMYQRTGEPLALGLVGLAQALPDDAIGPTCRVSCG
ncbi:MAG: hypothetical protein R2867_42225 [Caldilineaceae bacterium]